MSYSTQADAHSEDQAPPCPPERDVATCRQAGDLIPERDPSTRSRGRDSSSVGVRSDANSPQELNEHTPLAPTTQLASSVTAAPQKAHAKIGPIQTAVNFNGNKLIEADRPIHEWYRFVLSFPPHLVRDYLNRFQVPRGHPGVYVLDPFCGTGTTLVECKRVGIDAYGIEANPMAHFATQVKTNWSIDPSRFRAHSTELAKAVEAQLEAEGYPDFGDLPLFQRRVARPSSGRLKTLTPEQWKILSPGFISALPLHKALTILEHIRAAPDQTYRNWQELALAKALVTDIGNLHFGPEIGVCTPLKNDAAAVSSWLHWCNTMASDIESVAQITPGHVKSFQADARRSLPTQIPDQSIDAVITSPPYPNEKDYTRTTRLESVVLGILKSRSDLRALKTDLLRSNTRNVFKGDDDHVSVMTIPEIVDVASRIEARRIELGKTSGFERLYHKVTLLYFGGMYKHLAELRRVLKPNARCAYVVGDQASYFRVMIRTGELLGLVAERLGYEIESIDLFRTRLATATREQLREEVVVLRWPGSSAILEA